LKDKQLTNGTKKFSFKIFYLFQSRSTS